MIKLRPLRLLLVSLLCGMIIQPVSADVTVNIKGTVVVPPCTINNGEIIEYDFGDAIPVSKFEAGGSVAKSKNFRVTCTNSPTSNGINLSLSGAAGGPVGTIGTSKPELAIRMLVSEPEGGTTYLDNNAIATGFTFSLDEDQLLIAVLIKSGADEPTEGSFTGSATLTASIP